MAWNSVALLPFLSRALRVTWPLRQRFALVTAYVAGFAVARAVEHSDSSFGGLLLSLILGSAAYLAAFLASGGLNQRDRDRLTEMIGRARSRRGRPESAVGEGSFSAAD
jgi:hypothetical protein